jgi:hypothetical protein
MVISKIATSIIQPQACGRFVIPVSPASSNQLVLH